VETNHLKQCIGRLVSATKTSSIRSALWYSRPHECDGQTTGQNCRSIHAGRCKLYHYSAYLQ